MKWLKQVFTALVIAAASTVLTNLITGQPLNGLTKLKGLSQTFFRSSVPAWMFALVLFAALFGLYRVIQDAVKNRKGHVYFVPDAYNCGWAARSETQMEVRAGGTFTYQGKGTLTILKAFLKGTKPVEDMMVEQEASGGSRKIVSVRQLDLDAHIPIRAYISLRLTPVRGTQGKRLNSHLVFQDKYNRRYSSKVSLPDIGQRHL